MGDKMIYKKFYFKNYKGIKETSIEFDNHSNLCCIVGINESGKTTILKGIYDIFTLLTGGSIDNLFEECIDKTEANFTGEMKFAVELIADEDSRKKFNFRKNDNLKCEFIYHIKQDKYDLSYSTPFEKKCYKITNTCTHNEVELSKEECDKIFTIIKNDKLYPCVYYCDDFFIEVPEEIYFQTTNSKKNYSNEVFYWQDIFNNIGKESLMATDEFGTRYTTFPGFQSLVDDYFDEQNISNKGNLNKNLNKIQVHLTKTIKDNLIFKDEMKDFDRVEIRIKTNKKPEVGFQIVFFDTDGNEFLLSDKSLGFRWFFSFLLFTFYRKSKNVLFLLDEPASNLFAGVQEKIMESFKKLTKQNCYIAYSTHTVYLYHETLLKSTHIAIKENGIGIKIYNYLDILDDEKKLACARIVTDYFRIKKDFMLLKDKNIFVEGKEDWFIIELFCKKILSRIGDIDIFYCGGSSSATNYIDNATCMKKKFMMILDNDNGLECYTKYQRYYKWLDGGVENGDNYKIIVKNNLKSLNDLLKNENIGAIQTLICEDDKVKIYNFAFNCNEIQLSKDEKEKKKIVNKAIRKIVCENLLNEHMDCLHELEKSLSQQTKDNFTKLADAIEKHFNLK